MKKRTPKPKEDVIPFMAEIDPDKPVLDVYAILGNDLAEENLENDLSAADREDL